MKKALITGITGQDGSYLAEQLLDRDYEVHGLVRRVTLEDPTHRLRRIRHIQKDLRLHLGTIESYARLLDIFEDVKPDECYHLAAQSFLHESFEDSHTTFDTNITGVLNTLTALKRKSPDTRFFFAGSSEMFGKVEETPQTEETKFHPRSPYGITKVTGFEITRNFREAYNIFACSGIFFNHESPRRGYEFVTRKITSNLAKISCTGEGVLKLGNLEAQRDWGFAGDYVDAMWKMLQRSEPEDYVVATGESHTVREFVESAARHAGMDLYWDGEGINECGIDRTTERKVVEIDPKLFRPSEVNLLLGNASKARRELGWKPRVYFDGLVSMMVESDLRK
ncbi:MAG: GDP-mannose 4,6-dehydratase [Nanoarchaeota archaeon]|nr:GDP-mannose 4,6-dehydratase [Nanoarchaeota archaeon]